MFNDLCSIENLYSAFKKAKKGKGKKKNIVKFEKNLEEEIKLLRTELLLKSYSPKPLCKFVIRDPKTRKISASAFRDRVVHHALCNIIEPVFDKTFIYDSFANRINKGTTSALKRFDYFKRKVSKSNSRNCYILKADVKQYFENVDHKILLGILKRKINDEEIIWLIKKIIKNYSNDYKGMPLGNLTSQFFANVYLNELDQFIKHKLRVKYYIRYVDDFVIFHSSKKILNQYRADISEFLRWKLKIELHPNKSRVIRLAKGVNFLVTKREVEGNKIIKFTEFKDELEKEIFNLVKQKTNVYHNVILSNHEASIICEADLYIPDKDLVILCKNSVNPAYGTIHKIIWSLQRFKRIVKNVVFYVPNFPTGKEAMFERNGIIIAKNKKELLEHLSL